MEFRLPLTVATIIIMGLILLSDFQNVEGTPQNRNIINQHYQTVLDIQEKLKEHRETRRKYDGTGKRIYKSVSEIQADLRRPYDARVGGFYTPMVPRPGLTDIRCTRKGMLGCGDRCFTPHTYTRCVNGKVTGPELPFPEW